MLLSESKPRYLRGSLIVRYDSVEFVALYATGSRRERRDRRGECWTIETHVILHPDKPAGHRRKRGLSGWLPEARATVEDEGRASSSSDFGALLRRHRLAAGLSQEALAERARVSADGISALERGHRRTPQRETLALLTRALELDGERRQEFEAAATRPATARAGGGASPDDPAALPLTLASFVGRERELREICELLLEHRLVTITGAGGVGKTQTALRAASETCASDGVRLRFVSLVSIAEAAQVASAVAAAVGVREAPGRPLLETLIPAIREKQFLLVLDNCEHVIEQAARVADALLAGCPALRILATSREPLRTPGENTYRLRSLSPEAAAELFVHRARAMDHRFELSDANAGIVADLCRRLDGIPLAIELAAARVDKLSLESLARRIDDRFRILTGGARAALPRQQTMRATIDWSYDLLSERERRVFERMSVFAGGCTLEGAAQVCSGGGLAEDDVFDVLSSLVDKSLVVVDRTPNDPRYRLLESFREYAAEKLAARGEYDDTVHRHLAAYLELAERMDRAYYDDPSAYRHAAEAELDNWRLALTRSLRDRRDSAAGMRLAAELAQTVWLDHAPLEGRRWITAAFGAADAAGAAVPRSTIGKLSYGVSVLAQHFNDAHLQLEMARRAIECFAATGDALGTARAQSLAADALMRQGNTGEARALEREALRTARELDVPRLVAYLLRGLASASFFDGDIATARVLLAEALREYERAGSELGAASALNDLSICECIAGDVDAAIEKIDRALATAREFHQTRSIIHCLTNATTYLILQRRYDDAYERGHEALQLALDQTRGFAAFEILNGLAIAAALRRHAEPGEAERCANAAARILGYVNANAAARGWVMRLIEPHEYERILGAMRAVIGADSVTALMAAGEALTEEEACAQAARL